ncbi:MAG: Uma2 family endonuclease [Bryobacteraceae bacterium]
MAANPAHLMTVEEFRQLPEPVGDYNYELHHGELVPVTRPKLKHHILQSRLRDLLRQVAPPGGFVEIEVAFRAFPEHDLRVADVGFVSAERWAQADLEDNIRDAPDIVIEVLSPSNTAREMYEKEQLCLAHGSKEFWVVDPDDGYVRISRVNGPTSVYRPGQQIPLPLFGGATLAVDDLFV